MAHANDETRCQDAAETPGRSSNDSMKVARSPEPASRPRYLAELHLSPEEDRPHE